MKLLIVEDEEDLAPVSYTHLIIYGKGVFQP